MSDDAGHSVGSRPRGRTGRRVVILYNPVAGKGRARQSAGDLAAGLERHGHAPTLMESQIEPAETWLPERLGAAEALIVVGGDGAMRQAGDPAARAATPIYHYPQGTENLFAREFGADRSVSRLAEALDHFAVSEVDVGSANDRPFLLMASVGFDAEVVHDLAAHRRGGISHLSYACPMARQFVRWRPPLMRVRVDGEELVDARGIVIVANSRQYAQRLDPAARASMEDGLLDVVFFPAESKFALAGWIARCVRGRHLLDRRMVYGRGAQVEIECDEPQRYQLDGDPPESWRRHKDELLAAEGIRASRLTLDLAPYRLPVLLHANSRTRRPRADLN